MEREGCVSMFFRRWLRWMSPDNKKEKTGDSSRRQDLNSGVSEGKGFSGKACSDEDQETMKKKLQSLGYM
jgi:hypothetical protein